MSNRIKPLTWLIKLISLCFKDCMDDFRSEPITDTATQGKSAAGIHVPTKSKENKDQDPEVILMELSGRNYQFRKTSETGYISVSQEAFPPIIADLGEFGMKLIPSANVVWTTIGKSPKSRFEDAIMEFIKNDFRVVESKPVLILPPDCEKANTNTCSPPPAEKVEAATSSILTSRPREVVIGKLIKAEVMKFPDRKHPSETYQTFGVLIRTKSQDRTLQGEGLRDALAQSGAKVGDDVIVKRLDQVLVPLLDKNTHLQLHDDQGKPRMTPKWQWSIFKNTKE